MDDHIDQEANVIKTEHNNITTPEFSTLAANQSKDGVWNVVIDGAKYRFNDINEFLKFLRDIDV